MSSAIDPSKPTEGTATTASVRDNFAAAKTEIEQLQDDVAQALSDAADAIAAASAAATAWQVAYPVGSIYLSVLSTNPNTLLGFGTWAEFGAGRVMVGQDSTDPDFDTLEETGGEKTHQLTEAEMPEHTHIQNPHNHTQNAHGHSEPTYNTDSGASGLIRSGSGLVAGSVNINATTATNNAATATNQNTGGGEAHNNLQPYIVVKIWKRTA